MKIRIFVFEGVGEFDFVAPLEVFRRAANLVSGLDVALVTLDAPRELTGEYGLRFVPDAEFDGSAGLVLIPGGGYLARARHGVRHQIAQGMLPRIVAELHERGTIVAGVCTGVMVLAAAGLLHQRAATTHDSALDDLRATSANVILHRLVDDGDILTCGGVTSSIDLAFYIVKRFWGAEIAAQIADAMEYTFSADVYIAESAEA